METQIITIEIIWSLISSYNNNNNDSNNNNDNNNSFYNEYM